MLLFRKGSNDIVTLLGSDYDFWANPDTNVNTTWYVDEENSFRSGPYYNSNRTSLTHDVTGQYYNWDWSLDSYATYTKHWSRVIGYSDDYDYDFNAIHWGEDSSLLFVDVFVNGSQIY